MHCSTIISHSPVRIKKPCTHRGYRLFHANLIRISYTASLDSAAMMRIAFLPYCEATTLESHICWRENWRLYVQDFQQHACRRVITEAGNSKSFRHACISNACKTSLVDHIAAQLEPASRAPSCRMPVHVCWHELSKAGHLACRCQPI
jgi:hypothetical protein